jgi:hypothetical protein
MSFNVCRGTLGSLEMMSAIDPAVDNDGRTSDERATAWPNAASDQQPALSHATA